MQGGYTVIGTDSSGIASHSTSTETGALYTLNPSGAVYSPFVSDATCTFVAFSSNYSTVDAFVVTKSNFQTMLSGVCLLQLLFAAFFLCLAAIESQLHQPEDVQALWKSK